ncbi:Glutamate receptor [Thalictrum thalictroides]|uniref:Glutamate receptor n=1 Tax=Thalictrum thalictroides TaxID=46969 RepID=A0A7J6WSP5_THATH|nr:Glutamate receptor [Thalictrum thalictroides]
MSAEERVISNLARFVVIIWVFVVLILTSSYTASLTSMLTVQKYQPTVTDISDLKKNGDFVGYQKGSFVYELMESMGFDLTKLRPYDTLEEYHVALKKGSRNGGVSAIMDEIPYIKLFLAKYCNKYMMVGPTHRTAGFGFAFPKGSPLVPDISRAVLNVTQGEKMDAIDRAWFGTQDFCPDQGGSTITSDSLTLDDFKGLFLIAGAASSFAFLLFLLIFLYEQRTILTSEGSISQKISSMALKFDSEKDITSSGSKKRSPERSSRTAADYDTSTPQTPITCISLQQEDMVSSQEESFPCTEPSTRTQDLPSTIEITSTN